MDGLSAGGWVRTAGCCRGAAGDSEGGGDTSAGGLLASPGLAGVTEAGLSFAAGCAGTAGVAGCVCAGCSAGSGAALGAGDVVFAGEDAGWLFLSSSIPPNRYHPAKAATRTIPRIATHKPDDDFFLPPAGICAGGG